MKHFCGKSFQNHLDNAPFHVCNIFDNIDDICWAQNKLLTSVLNEHAPLKVKCINKPQVPYVNSELRKAMHNRNMWRGKHFRNKNAKYSRSMYVKWRNKVVRLRKISIQNYFDLRCNKNITRWISTKQSVRFCLISLHLAMVKVSFVMTGISYPIHYKLPIYLICIIRLSQNMTAPPTGSTVLPLRMLYWNMHHMKAYLSQSNTLPRVRTFDLRLFHTRPSNATSTNWNPTKQQDLTDYRQKSWNCQGINILVSYVTSLIGAFVLTFSLHIWNLLK